MLKRILILSISMWGMVLGLKPALGASSETSVINTSQIPLTAVSELEEKPKDFTLTLGLERGSYLTAENNSSDKTATTALIQPSLKLSENLSGSIKTFVEQQENGPRNTSLSDTQVGLSLIGTKITEEIGTSYSISGIAPTSEENRKTTRFQGAGSLGLKIAGDFVFASVSYSLSLRRNVHEFNISNDGKANIRDVIGQTVSLSIPLSEKFSISSDGIYRNSWTYGNSLRQSFGYHADLNYEPIKNLSFNIGTSNEGSALKANGKDSNIQFYDEKSSIIRAGVTYVL